MDVIDNATGQPIDWGDPSFDDLSQPPMPTGATIPPNTPTGVTDDPSFLSSGYWTGKIAEFQRVLDAADRTYQAAQAVLFTEQALDPRVWDSLTQACAEYESRRALMRTTAEAINLGVRALNSMGMDVHSLRLPGSLGFLPAVPVAAIAALGVAATLTVWGREWIAGVNSRLKFAQALAAQTSPEAAARLAASVATTEAAKKDADGGILATLAPLVKWGAIAGLAFLAWRAIERGKLSA